MKYTLIKTALSAKNILIASTLTLSLNAMAVPLSGVMSVDSGSFFSMSGTTVALASGSDGGIILGTYQNFQTTPDIPHPQGWQGDTNGDGVDNGSAGAGYDRSGINPSNMLLPFQFFGLNTYIGINPISYQSGNAAAAPTADIDLTSCVNSVCDLAVDLSAWEVFWNGNVFQQGPRPDNTGPFVAAMGSYNQLTGAYSLSWASQIKQGPFNGVVANWHLEGTVSAVPVPAAVWLFMSGLGVMAGFVRQKRKPA